MIIAIDVGNTNVVLGIFDEDKKICETRMSTDLYGTAEEYAVKINGILNLYDIKKEKVEGGIISTVVPPLVRTLSKAIELVIDKKPLVVGPGLKTGLNIKIDNPAEMGADLVVGAVAAIKKYSCPMVIFDLGTATTASVIDKNGAYIGGAILCGVKTAINALSEQTAQLPLIDITAPTKLIGTNTIDCMKCGSVIGTATMIDGLVKKFEKELGEKTTVVITGGLGSSIARCCETDVIVDDDLLLEGLKIVFEKNK